MLMVKIEGHFAKYFIAAKFLALTSKPVVAVHHALHAVLAPARQPGGKRCGMVAVRLRDKLSLVAL